MAKGVRTYKGFKPYLHQADVIAQLKDARGTGKIVSVNSSRQKGKSRPANHKQMEHNLGHSPQMGSKGIG